MLSEDFNEPSFRCPHCQVHLVEEARSLQCVNGHSFDVAKEGYVNLLPANKKNSKDPGDNALMIASRAQFLEQDYYAPLTRRLAETFEKSLAQSANRRRVCLLDIGCGEGYYLSKIKRLLGDNSHLYACGLDISKSAVKRAAKRRAYEKVSVSSAFELPYFDNSFDVLLSIFAPLASRECLRVLKPQGKLITVNPDSKHLIQIAEKAYTTKRDLKSLNPVLTEPEWMHISKQSVRFEAKVEKQDIKPLLQMTPYYYSLKAEVLAELAEQAALCVTAHFAINTLTKRP